MSITTFSVASIPVLDAICIDKSDAINQPNISKRTEALGASELNGQTDTTKIPDLLQVPTTHKAKQSVSSSCQPKIGEPYVKVGSNGKESQAERSPLRQLLFRVTHNQSMGTSPCGRATLPGSINRRLPPLHDEQFNWRTWLTRHGNKFDKNLSIGTSFTSNFLHALSIALRYHRENKSGITVLIIQTEFLIPGTCLRFDDLIAWSGLPWSTFRHKKKNEHLVIGSVPPAAFISRFTFKSLEGLGYKNLFPRLPLGSMPNKELDDLRTVMRLESEAFDIAEHQTKLFLACLLGNQEGVCPHDLSTRQLVVHFVALAKGCVFHHFAIGDIFKGVNSIEDFERNLDRETLGHIDAAVRDIKMLQEMNKEINVDINERFHYQEEDIEGAVKRWAVKNPVCKEILTPGEILSTTGPPQLKPSGTGSRSIQLMPAPPILSLSDPFRSNATENGPFHIHRIPSTSRPFTPAMAPGQKRPTTPSAPTEQSPNSYDSFTPTSSFPSPPPTSPLYQRRSLSNQNQSQFWTPSKKRKIINLEEEPSPKKRQVIDLRDS